MGISQTPERGRAVSHWFFICAFARATNNSPLFPPPMSRFKVLVADPISPRGVEELRADAALDVSIQTRLKEDQLISIIGEYSALVVRSETKVNARVIQAATNLKVV